MQENKIFFLEFLKCWPSSRDFNKLVIKAKCIPKTYFWNFLCCIQIQYVFFIYFWETWPYAWKQNIFFIFFNVLTKTGYFNTEFISLQYKNTNRYWSKCNKKIYRKSHFFLNFFLMNLIFLGSTQPGPCGGAGPSKPGLVHAWVNLFHACMNSAKVIKLPSHSVYAHL